MKRTILLIVVMLFTLSSVGCGNDKNGKEPDVAQIRSICNLATLECYYHNVAKSEKKAGDSFLSIGEKDRTFWIEYTGIARVGIDMSKVDMKIDGQNITVTMPNAELLSKTIDEKTLNEDSYITSSDGLNSNKITAQDQTDAIENAQATMEESVKNNSTLLLNAQTRAQELIENYINQMGKVAGIDYNIKWEYIDED